MCELATGKFEVSMECLIGHHVFSFEAHLCKRSTKHKFIRFLKSTSWLLLEDGRFT